MGVDDFSFAEEVVRKAGDYIRVSLQTGYETIWKPDNTPVTSIDTAVNTMIIEEIRRAYPTDRIYGEEESSDAETPSGMTWVVDPIDGTQAIGLFPTSTCCLARLGTDGKPLFGLVFNPATNELFSAKRGETALLNGEPLHVSSKTEVKSSYVFLSSRMPGDVASNGVVYGRLESAGAKIINIRSLAFGCVAVAAGKAEGAYIGARTPFEAAAVALIVEGACGKVTDLRGQEPGRFDVEIRGLIVSNGLVHDALVEACKKGE